MFSIMDAGAGSGGSGKPGQERACDSCKVRKVRCDMVQPCLPCSKKDLNCTFQRMRKKRGPTGKRIESLRRQRNSPPNRENGEQDYEHAQSPSSTVMNDQDISPNIEHGSLDSPWKSNMSQTSPGFPISIDASFVSHPRGLSSSTSAPIQDTLHQTNSTDSMTSGLTQNELLFPSLPVDSPDDVSEIFGSMLPHVAESVTPAQERWPTTVNEGTLLHWIDVYFKRLHPTMPILSRTSMYHDMLLRKHRTDNQYGAMLLSLCAFAMTQPVQIHEVAEAPSRSVQARMLIEECIKIRVAADFGEYPTIEMILTSFFLFACLFGNKQHGAASIKLHEAINLGRFLGIHQLSCYESLDSMTREKWLRTYLVLSVTERAYALQQGHPVSFRGQISFNARFLQTADASKAAEATRPFSYLLSHEPSDTHAMTGLLFLAETFSAFDENITECWNGQCKFSDGVCESFDRRRALQMFQAQRRAREMCLTGKASNLSSSRPLILAQLPETQQADISVTHFWLLNRLWSLCLSHDLLRDTSERPELRHDFACHVGKALWATCKALPFAAMEVHGVGLAEKIYDIALGVITALRLDANLSFQTGLTHADEDRIPVEPWVVDEEVPDVQSLLQSLSALLNNFRGGDHDYGSQLEAALASISV